jgi:hypothetical protein
MDLETSLVFKIQVGAARQKTQQLHKYCKLQRNNQFHRKKTLLAVCVHDVVLLNPIYIRHCYA